VSKWKCRAKKERKSIGGNEKEKKLICQAKDVKMLSEESDN
jgi:hypothetical protein